MVTLIFILMTINIIVEVATLIFNDGFIVRLGYSAQVSHIQRGRDYTSTLQSPRGRSISGRTHKNRRATHRVHDGTQWYVLLYHTGSIFFSFLGVVHYIKLVLYS